MRFYAFVGQLNTSCGNPNKITGRMSTYGINLVFESKKDRDRYVKEYVDYKGNTTAISCTKKELRAYNLGSSVADFEQDLQNCLVYWDAINERWEHV